MFSTSATVFVEFVFQYMVLHALYRAVCHYCEQSENIFLITARWVCYYSISADDLWTCKWQPATAMVTLMDFIGGSCNLCSFSLPVICYCKAVCVFVCVCDGVVWSDSIRLDSIGNEIRECWQASPSGITQDQDSFVQYVTQRGMPVSVFGAGSVNMQKCHYWH